MKTFVIIQSLLAAAVLIVCGCTEGRPVALAHRLATHLKTRPDYRVFIGMPLDTPSNWLEGSAYSANDVTVEGRAIPLQLIRSYLVVYPNGQVLDSAGIFYPLPAGLVFLERGQEVKKDVLDLSTLESGRRFAEVTFGPCTTPRGNRITYSTTLRNIGMIAFRVERFGGFSRKSGKYVLNTISGDYFSADEFQSWYGPLKDGWILPGESATDENNYGGRGGYWAYYCSTRDGHEFVAGGEVPAGR